MFMEPESGISEKPDPEPESVLFLAVTEVCTVLQTSLLQYKINIAELRLHQWLPETEQESDSQIVKISNPGPNSKTLEQERSLKM